MIWRKNIYGRNTLEFITLFAGMLLFFSFYQESYWLVYLGSFLIVICQLSIYYLKQVDKQLMLKNEKEIVRLAIDDHYDLIIHLSQASRLPIYKGMLKVKLESVVEGISLPSYQSDTELEISIPFHLMGRASNQITLPLKAIRRGATRIISLRISIENAFGFGSVDLEYNPFIYKEIIVHPKPHFVPHTEKLLSTKFQGDFSAPASVYEHILAPIGTRDYVYTDAFQRVHWKASAKTQSLQTKIFEKTTHLSWTFIINLRVPSMPNHYLGIVENMEVIASQVAYLGQFAIKRGIEFEVFINLRMANKTAVYHLPNGAGAKQLGKLLDSLSRINNRNGHTVPMNKLFYYVEKHQQKSPIVIYAGPVEEECTPYFSRLQKRGQKVFVLKDQDLPAVIPFDAAENRGWG
jgi:uncharacterized protein (DUF58 family)